MNKTELYILIFTCISITGAYSVYQLKVLGKNPDLKILYTILYVFYFFGIIIKSLVFHDVSEDLAYLLSDYNISEFVASNDYVIFYGLTITTIYFLIFNFFFWGFATKFKKATLKVLFFRNKNQKSGSKLPFIFTTSLFSLASLAGLLFIIGPSNLSGDFSAKRFSDSFSILTYLLFKLSVFSRIFYLYGRLHFPRLGFLGLPYLALQAFTILISSVVVSNRSYLFMFIIEVILIEFFNQRKGNFKDKLIVPRGKVSGYFKNKNSRRNLLLLPVIGLLVSLLLVITALRTAISQSLEPLQLVHLALLKVLAGRYLFDVMKLGEIYNFIISSPKDVTFYSFGWVAPLLIPNHKDIGVKIGADIFGLQNLLTGVTPGMFGELSYDFGVFLGALFIPVFCCIYWLIAQKLKLFIPISFFPVFWVTLLSKFILALNSSFGACLYSFVFDIIAIYAAYFFDKVRLGSRLRTK